MPACFITLSESASPLSDEQLSQIRQIIAEGLTSKSRPLDSTHIALRMISGKRAHMLGEIELDIFAQVYLRRLFSRDKRAKYISSRVSDCIGASCATWINMGMVGYSRVTPNGNAYFSDSFNPIIRFMQKIRGIATDEKVNIQQGKKDKKDSES